VVIDYSTTEIEKGRILGKGTFGIVYNVLVTQTQSTVALKVPNSNKPSSFTGTDEEWKKRVRKEFEEEKKWLESLKHKNIIQLLGHRYEGEDLWLFFPIYQSSLKDEMKKRISPVLSSWWRWNELKNLGLGIIEGLKYLHSERVAHLDLKVFSLSFLSFLSLTIF
jgi:serine/threonine protein kinase